MGTVGARWSGWITRTLVLGWLLLLLLLTPWGRWQADAVFCSRIHIQETTVRQRLLDTGQMVVSTHVLASLRVGETICITASLPAPEGVAGSRADKDGRPTSDQSMDDSDTNETMLENLADEEETQMTQDGKQRGETDGVHRDGTDPTDIWQQDAPDQKHAWQRHEGEQERVQLGGAGDDDSGEEQPQDTADTRLESDAYKREDTKKEEEVWGASAQRTTSSDGKAYGQDRDSDDGGNTWQTDGTLRAGFEQEGDTWETGRRQEDVPRRGWGPRGWVSRAADGKQQSASHVTADNWERYRGGRQEREARVPEAELRRGRDEGTAGGLTRLLLPTSRTASDDPDPAPESSRLHIQLTLEAIHHYHPITAAYNFSEPRLQVTCTCACASFHTCPACGELCVSIASSPVVADCEGSFLGSARTCCQLRLEPDQRFTAVRLGAAATFLRLRAAVSEPGRPADQRTVEAQLGDALQLQLNSTRLRVSSAGGQPVGGAPLPPGWYVLHEQRIYRPQQINEQNQYSVHRLGWLKMRGEDQHLMPSAGRLQAAVQVTTDSCTEQRFRVRNSLLLDSTLPQLGPPLVGLRVSQLAGSHVRLEPEPAPLQPLWLRIHLQQVRRLQYAFHQARLLDFSGRLLVDSRAAVLAELQLVNASGVQHGSVQLEYAPPLPPAQYRFSALAAGRLRLRLPVVLGAQQSTARLCLRPEGSRQPPLCRQLPVIRQPPDVIAADTPTEPHLTVNGQTNPTNNMERFLRALNPSTWFQSGGSWTNVLGAVVDVVIVIIVISIVWKCVSCFRSCCCRRKKK